MAKHNIGDYSIEAGENGLETEAFSIEEATITRTNETRPEADVIDTQSSLGSQVVSHSQFPVGSRFGASLPMRISDDGTDITGITSTSWTTIVEPLLMGEIHSPPNTVPVLQGWFHMGHADDGENIDVEVTRVSTDGYRSDPLLQFTGGAVEDSLMFDECYLNEKFNGTGLIDKNAMHLEIRSQVTGGTTGGIVRSDSSLKLVYEVI